MRTIHTRFIPAGSVKIMDKQSDAIAYLYMNRAGKPAAVVYYGKQSKSVGHHYFKTDAQREATVTRLFEARRARGAAMAEYTAKRLAPNKLTVGDILSTCWGYDQTNREFYEVLTVSGQHVTIRQLCTATDGDGFTGRCVPQSGQFCGEPMRKLVQHGDSVQIKSFIRATKWNTAKVAGVAIGPALAWSATH